MVVMEVIHHQLGVIGKELGFALDASTMIQNIADLIASLHVIITLPGNMDHVELLNLLLLARKLAILNTHQPPMIKTNGLVNQFILFHQKLKAFKLKS